MFRGSSDEICYGKVRIQPVIFQDDCLRMSTSVKAAQSGLDRIEMIMNQKTLKIHPDKSCYILAGSKTNIQRIREEIEKKPLKYKNFQLNEKVKEKWLGDQFHQAGLDASVNSTIKERIGKIKLPIFETNSIIEDVRMMVVGGVLGAPARDEQLYSSLL